MGDCTAGEPRVLRYSCNNRQAVLSLGIACMVRKQALKEASGRFASLAGVVVMPEYGDVDVFVGGCPACSCARGRSARTREAIRPSKHARTNRCSQCVKCIPPDRRAAPVSEAAQAKSGEYFGC